jgi:hypothetical protein
MIAGWTNNFKAERKERTNEALVNTTSSRCVMGDGLTIFVAAANGAPTTRKYSMDSNSCWESRVCLKECKRTCKIALPNRLPTRGGQTAPATLKKLLRLLQNIAAIHCCDKKKCSQHFNSQSKNKCTSFANPSRVRKCARIDD